MKKLTKEEAAKLSFKLGTSTVVRTVVMHLDLEEILLIEKKDWTQKNGPGQMLTRITEKTNRKFSMKTLADDSGWVVERVS